MNHQNPLENRIHVKNGRNKYIIKLADSSHCRIIQEEVVLSVLKISFVHMVWFDCKA